MTFVFGRLAPQLADDGWQPIPVLPGQKRPAVREWQRRPAPSVLRRWLERYPGHGVGLVCGRVVAVDIDVLDHDAAARLVALVIGLLGPTPLVRVGQAPKVVLVYRLAESMPITRRALSVGKIEMLTEGSFFVAYGIHPVTGEPYRWTGEGSPEFTPPSALQVVTPLQLENALDQALRLFPAVQDFESAQTSRAPVAASRREAVRIVTCPRSGRVLDGRDAHLARLVWAAAHSPEHPTAQEVAEAAWREFAATADLTRPARDGRRAWAFRDALAKARSALRKAATGAAVRVRRARGRIAVPTGEDLSENEREAVLASLLALHRKGRLNRSEWRVAELMVMRLRNGACVDSVWWLAQQLNICPSAIRRARRTLLRMGLFGTARQRGNREQTAPYFLDKNFLAKSLTGHVLSGGGVASQLPIYQGVGPPLPDVASASAALSRQDVAHAPAATPKPEPAHPTVDLPPQAPDAVQFSMIAPAVSDAELRAALAAWAHGPMPSVVRLAYAEKKRRLGLRECDIARLVRISREHIANARFETFGFSPEAVARMAHWLMPAEFPLPPRFDADAEKPARPHHRRGGKRPPDPGPRLPALRLFSVLDGGEPVAEPASQERRVAAA